MKIKLSLDDFRLLPHLWKSKLSEKEAQEYFGHTWCFAIYWLWFEFLFYGVPI
jgi:hypothetical protein